MLFDEHRNPIFGNHYQSVPAVWHLLLGLKDLHGTCPNADCGFVPIATIHEPLRWKCFHRGKKGRSQAPGRLIRRPAVPSFPL